MSTDTSIRLAADIGGTFTDVVLDTAGQRYTTKVLTTPRSPEIGVMNGVEVVLADSGVDAADI